MTPDQEQRIINSLDRIRSASDFDCIPLWFIVFLLQAIFWQGCMK